MTIKEQCAKYHLLGKKPHIHLNDGTVSEYQKEIFNYYCADKTVIQYVRVDFNIKKDDWLEESESNTETN